ncbi:hypothetical protein IE4872_PD00090 (plasmid) [Rhizobium gallicum]|uniref:Uncharacterized protein n=1 Tax=Rhizobium gallicum TaxID=56730 RepID=A0A1L5NRV2_9HYPH|nr:hypothetical protein IE4872_PD00090 [Rhizobium gallicum]
MIIAARRGSFATVLHQNGQLDPPNRAFELKPVRGIDFKIGRGLPGKIHRITRRHHRHPHGHGHDRG